MTPHVRLSSVGRFVGHIFKFHFPCSNKSTCSESELTVIANGVWRVLGVNKDNRMAYRQATYTLLIISRSKI